MGLLNVEGITHLHVQWDKTSANTNEEAPSREWQGCIHCVYVIIAICKIEITTLISMFFDGEGNFLSVLN